MSANGISTLATKALKQVAKLVIAQAKRQGKTVATNGTITGSVDSSKNYYRYWNTYDINDLPTKYTSNAVTDNANVGGLAAHRPWKTAPLTTTTPAPSSTSYAGTIDSSTANPFTFIIKKADNPGIATAFAQTNWLLKFDNTPGNTAVNAQAPGGFQSGSLYATDANYYYFNSWFGLGSSLPKGTPFTITW